MIPNAHQYHKSRILHPHHRTFKFDRVDNIGACIQESRENIIRSGAVNNIQPLQKLAMSWINMMMVTISLHTL